MFDKNFICGSKIAKTWKNQTWKNFKDTCVTYWIQDHDGTAVSHVNSYDNFILKASLEISINFEKIIGLDLVFKKKFEKYSIRSESN